MASNLHEDLEHVLEHTREVWEELRGARLFITGGTGLFGCWILETLLFANERLKLEIKGTVLSRDPAAFGKRFPHLGGAGALEFVRGDVCAFAFPAGKFSHVIHAATEASAKLNEEDPLRMLDTIVVGTRRVLDFARECGARKILLTSSGAVYGRQPAGMTNVGEDYLGAPETGDLHSAYGQGKRMAEHLCALYQQRHGIEAKIARCFAFVGPHLPLDRHFAIGNFIRDGLEGRAIEVAGDGTPYRSYLYMADLSIWLWTILVRGQSGRAYNVGSEEGLSIAELAEKVAGYFGTTVRIGRPAVAGAAAQRYVPSTARAAEELGLKQWIGLEDAIARTAAWYR